MNRRAIILRSRLTAAALAFAVAALLVVTGPARAGGDEPSRPAPTDVGRLFDPTAVWTVHLTFTPDQWAAMDPKGGRSLLGLMLFGDGRGGDRVPQAGEVSGFLAPALLREGDRDGDGRLSAGECRGVAGRWFAAWDEAKAGKVDAARLRAALDVTLAPPPGAAPPPDRVNRGIGFGLQGSEGKRNGLASAMGIEFQYVRADLDFQGRALKDVAVRYKGNGTFVHSRGSLKRSLKIDLNRFTEGQKLAGVTSLNLHSCVLDASWMNEVLSHRLYRDAGVPAPRTAYARVYVTVAGKHDRTYLGLYSLVEDVGDKAFAKDRFGTAKGVLFKPVTPEPFADLGDDWANYNQTYDPKSEPTDAQARRVIEFARLITRAGDDELAAKLGDYLDLDNFARYMAVTTYLSAMDSILMVGQNYYAYLHPKTNKFVFLPWDLDLSFGQFPMAGTQEQREQLSLNKPWPGRNRFLERVYKVPAFQEAYQARLKEFGDSIFKPERFHRQVDETAAAIRDAVKDESADKLARFDKVAAGDPLQPAGFFRSPPVKPIKSFVTARWDSFNEQLAGRSDGKTIDARGRGGRGRPGGAGQSVGPPLMAALDADRDGSLDREEVVGGFDRWFAAWDAAGAAALTEDQLRAGIDRTLGPAARPRQP